MIQNEAIMSSIYQKYQDLKSQARDILFGYPDVIIFGENHIDPTHKDEQAKAIMHYKPEFVLLEGLNDLNSQETEKLNKIYFKITLEELAEHFNINLNEIGITSNTVPNFNQYLKNYATELAEHFVASNIHNPEKAKEAANKSVYSGTVPENVEQLITAPLYNFSSASYMAIMKLFSDENMNYKDSLSSSDDVWNLKNYLTQIEPILRSNFPHEVMRASALIGTKLAGCDIDKDNLPKTDTENASTPEDLVSSLTNLRDYVNDVNEEREKTMATRIVEFANQRKKSAPVIAVVGSTHIKRSSFIHPGLRSTMLKYRTIKQRSKIPESKSYGYALDLILKK